MARPKSTMKQVVIDVAIKSHNCKRNSAHRILKGSKRLKIKSSRNFHTYCVDCAKAILQGDLAKIQNLLSKFD